MKKTLSIAALSTVLVFGMAAGAMATHLSGDRADTVASAGAAKITIDGAIRQRGAINKANPAKNAAADSYYDGRVRLGVKAQVTSQASAYIQLETGEGSTHDYGWGNVGDLSGLNKGGYKDSGSLLTPRQAWINYNASSFSLKVGHQLLALGNKVFFDHTGHGDDAIMAYTAVGDTHLAGILIKFDEQKKGDSTDDLDGYVAVATHKFNDNLDGGINWTYLKGAAKTGDLNLDGVPNGMSMSNIGINANYRQDNLSFLADTEFQFGDVSDNGTTTVKAKGWAVKLEAKMDLGAAKVGLLYGYGSGDDGTDPTTQDTFINFLNDTNYDTILIGYRAAVPGQGTKHTGLANLSEYQINLATKTTCPLTGKPLSLFASATYAQLNESINTYGTNKEDKVGTEFDAIAKWSLAPGLFYKVEAGYLFTGSAWDTSAAGSDNLYFLRHQLAFSF